MLFTDDKMSAAVLCIVGGSGNHAIFRQDVEREPRVHNGEAAMNKDWEINTREER